VDDRQFGYKHEILCVDESQFGCKQKIPSKKTLMFFFVNLSFFFAYMIITKGQIISWCFLLCENSFIHVHVS
jgi:hypothetical protein